MLQVRIADCMPIIISADTGVFGILHAGRSGTESGILSNALALISENYPATSSMAIWFGPHICADCYEINRSTQETYGLVAKNLAQINSFQSKISCAVEIDATCTLEDEDWYSHRGGAQASERNYITIWKQKQGS